MAEFAIPARVLEAAAREVDRDPTRSPTEEAQRVLQAALKEWGAEWQPNGRDEQGRPTHRLILPWEPVV